MTVEKSDKNVQGFIKIIVIKYFRVLENFKTAYFISIIYLSINHVGSILINKM